MGGRVLLTIECFLRVQYPHKTPNHFSSLVGVQIQMKENDGGMFLRVRKTFFFLYFEKPNGHTGRVGIYKNQFSESCRTEGARADRFRSFIFDSY